METSQTSQSSQKLQAFCWRLALNRCLQPLLLSAAFQLHQWDGTKWWWSAAGAAIQQEWCRSAPLVESWVMMDLIVALRYTFAWVCIQTKTAKLCWNVSSLGYILSKAFSPSELVSEIPRKQKSDVIAAYQTKCHNVTSLKSKFLFLCSKTYFSKQAAPFLSFSLNAALPCVFADKEKREVRLTNLF